MRYVYCCNKECKYNIDNECIRQPLIGFDEEEEEEEEGGDSE